jgi:hypothetical protein
MHLNLTQGFLSFSSHFFLIVELLYIFLSHEGSGKLFFISILSSHILIARHFICDEGKKYKIAKNKRSKKISEEKFNNTIVVVFYKVKFIMWHMSNKASTNFAELQFPMLKLRDGISLFFHQEKSEITWILKDSWFPAWFKIFPDLITIQNFPRKYDENYQKWYFEGKLIQTFSNLTFVVCS